MPFPLTQPNAEPVFLWSLQNDLLALAERNLGSRDLSKTIYQPTFAPDGPRLINSPTLDGAFAQLSMNAAGYWPTAVFELAHETVHLLNPTVGYTNWLEEGIAVAFSAIALVNYNLPVIRPNLATYVEALTLVQDLPGGAFLTARRAREVAGALSSVTYEQLAEIAPDHNNDKLRQLTARCVPR